jgi:hypothetical protein
MVDSRLDELASASPELRLVLDELRGSGLRDYVGPDPLLVAGVPADHLSEFLSRVAREVSDRNLYGLAVALPACIHRRGAGEEALDHILASGRLSARQREAVVQQRIRLAVRGDGPLADRHRALAALAVGHPLDAYRDFLVQNLPDLALTAPEDLGLVILDPRTSPRIVAFECLEPLIEHAPDPRPFVDRGSEWIRAGALDQTPENEHTYVGIFYHILDDNWHKPRFDPLRRTMFVHLIDLIRAPHDLAKAWHHLNVLVDLRDCPRLGETLCDLVAGAGILVTPHQRAALLPLLQLLRRPDARDTPRYQEQLERIRATGPPGPQPEGDAFGPAQDPASYLVPPSHLVPSRPQPAVRRSFLRSLFRG